MVPPSAFSRLAPLILLAAALLAVPGRDALAQATAPQDQLWDAAMQGDTAALSAALGRGAAIDSLDTRRTPNGRRALNWAAWFDRPAAIRFLVAQGSRLDLPNWTGFTPLHHAAENGSLAAARALLLLGADRTLRNGADQSPADVARERGHLDVAALLDSLPSP